MRLDPGDDGDGLNQSMRLGLIGMRERVQALNGTFDYQTSIGEGFKIFIRIPLEQKS